MAHQMDVFDTICGALLLHLYNCFPVRVDVEFSDLPIDEELNRSDLEDIEQWTEVFFETANWLEREGFIRSSGGTDDRDLVGAQLTMSGLAVLRAIPLSVDCNKKSSIEKIKSAFGEGGKVVSSETLKLAVSSVFSMASSVS